MGTGLDLRPLIVDTTRSPQVSPLECWSQTGRNRY